MQDNSRFSDFNIGEFERGNWGFYTLFDQVLVRFGERGSHRGFGIAGSFLVSPDQSISQMPYFFTAALVTRGIFPSRPIDVIGLGVVYGHFRPDLQNFQRQAQQFNPNVGVQSHETVVELTYRLALLEKLRSSSSRTCSKSSGRAAPAGFQTRSSLVLKSALISELLMAAMIQSFFASTKIL